MKALHFKQSRPFNKRWLALLLSLCLLTTATVGGTYAWMYSKTGSKINTFKGTDITLTFSGISETQRMVPGEHFSIPNVTVKANSVPCYLFMRLYTSNRASCDTYLSFSPNSYSTYTFSTYTDSNSDNRDIYYYTTIGAPSVDSQYNAFLNGRITVKTTVTKEQLASVDDFTVNVQYCAVQQSESITSVDQAFNLCAWS